MERSTTWRYRLASLHCLACARCVCECVCIYVLPVVLCDHHRKHNKHCLSQSEVSARPHSMSKGMKDDANRCRLAIMKHNYSFIRRCNCFVRASQCVLVVRRLILPLYNAHAHPYLTRYVICDTPILLLFCELSLLSLWREVGFRWWWLVCCEVQWGSLEALAVSVAIGILCNTHRCPMGRHLL